MAGKEEKTRFYRLFYWSTRQKCDISEPYGQNDYSDRGAMERARDELMQSKDMYRTEMWERLAVQEQEIYVEKYHGNPAHLKLK